MENALDMEGRNALVLGNVWNQILEVPGFQQHSESVLQLLQCPGAVSITWQSAGGGQAGGSAELLSSLTAL